MTPACEIQPASGPGRPGGADITDEQTLKLLAMGAAHDLGNHLQVVASVVRLIDRALSPAASAELHPLTQGALASVDRAAALSRRILTMTTAEVGPAESIRLDEAVAALEHLVGITAGPLIAVTFDYGEDVPPVACDARELEDAVLNLVINARDAMPRGGRLRLAVSAERAVAPGWTGEVLPTWRAVLRVSDTGCGMSAETLHEVFRPFFTTKPPTRGAGLGLAMVRTFAERIGGCADIESRLGEGTTVTLRLPRG